MLCWSLSLFTMALLSDGHVLFLCVGGIYLFYLLFGIYQEDMYVPTFSFLSLFFSFLFSFWALTLNYLLYSMSRRFGPEKEKFSYTSFLLMTQSIINAFCAFIGTSSFSLLFMSTCDINFNSNQILKIGTR